MKIVLSPNPYRDRGLKAALQAERVLRGAGIQTSMCLPFQLDKGSKLEFPKGIDFLNMDEELKKADMLICFGGDGTILHAAKSANAHHVPILGVNMGSVGFMAELEQGELKELSRLIEGRYTVERRMMLDVKATHEGRVIFRDTALNDAVITKGAVARIIDFSVLADQKLITDFSGDGIILSTPTGSTAYSMSAGGPIVEPTAENIIITPICAHALQARSFVLGRDRVVTARMGKLSHKTAFLSVDGGKAVKLSGGDSVETRRSRDYTRLVRLTDRSFYDIVGQKLGKG